MVWYLNVPIFNDDIGGPYVWCRQTNFSLSIVILWFPFQLFICPHLTNIRLSALESPKCNRYRRGQEKIVNTIVRGSRAKMPVKGCSHGTIVIATAIIYQNWYNAWNLVFFVTIARCEYLHPTEPICYNNK